jgi:hypothetical protein
MMEALRTSETSVNIYFTTRQYIPEDSKLHTRRRKNLKSHILQMWSKFFIPSGKNSFRSRLKGQETSPGTTFN